MSDGWNTTTIGTVCKVVNGGTPKTKVAAYWNGPHAWITPAEMGKRTEPMVGQTARTITDGGLENSSAKLLPPMSVILSSRAPIGHVVINSVTMATNQGCKGLIPNDNLDVRFLALFLISNVDHLNSLGTGATFKELSSTKLKSMPIAVPPLAEQKQIVAILDEAFSAIAKAKAAAEKNLANARELFESYLNRVFTRRGDGWEEKPLGEIADFKNGLNYTKNSNGQTLPVVGVGDFQENFYVPVSELETATIDGELDPKYAIQQDDILTVRSNGSKRLIGRCMLVPDVIETTSYSGFVIRIRINTAKMFPRFLLHFMKSRKTVDRLTHGGGGANINNINQTKLSKLPVAFPSDYKQQERLADVLDHVSQESARLQTIYQQKLANLDELKQSLLQKAFTGQLTARMAPQRAEPAFVSRLGDSPGSIAVGSATGASAQTADIGFPATVDDISTTDLHAGILALAYRKHEAAGQLKTFGHVKGEKIAHLVESYVGVDLGRNPVKDAAGPNDYPHLKKVEFRARMAGYFNVKRKGKRYELTPLTGFDAHVNKTSDRLGERLEKVKQLIDLMLEMNTGQAEVFATTYAAWNNLLLDGDESPTDEAIVYEARENWDPKKLAIDRNRFFKAIEWMREQRIVPQGRGKKVVAKPR